MLDAFAFQSSPIASNSKNPVWSPGGSSVLSSVEIVRMPSEKFSFWHFILGNLFKAEVGTTYTITCRCGSLLQSSRPEEIVLFNNYHIQKHLDYK